jgi:hypothetical protein
MKHSLPETNYERRVAAMEQVGKRRMERLVESRVLAYDPGDNTEQVRKINMELRKPLPTLFKKNQIANLKLPILLENNFILDSLHDITSRKNKINSKTKLA